MDLSKELAEALAAAEAAGKYVLNEYQAFTPIPDAPAEISTHVDCEAQEIIVRHLRAAFPHDGIRAEEATASVSSESSRASRVWVIDPIDGTRGFARKNGEFSVMIGFTVESRAVLGVVLEPVANRVTYAAAGVGCWTQSGTAEPIRCQVTTQSNLASSVFVQSHTKPGAAPKPVVAAIEPGRVVETYSAGIKLAMVARGEVDLYVNDYVNFHDWDACAGHVLVEEAGGMVTLFNGEPIIYVGPVKRRGLLATNGLIHQDCLQRLSLSIAVKNSD